MATSWPTGFISLQLVIKGGILATQKPNYISHKPNYINHKPKLNLKKQQH